METKVANTELDWVYDLIAKLKKEVKAAKAKLGITAIFKTPCVVVGRFINEGVATRDYMYQIHINKDRQVVLEHGLHVEERISYLSKELADDIVNGKYGKWYTGGDEEIPLETISRPEFYRSIVRQNERTLKNLKECLFKNPMFDKEKYKAECL